MKPHSTAPTKSHKAFTKILARGNFAVNGGKNNSVRAKRIKTEHLSSDDQPLSMVMGGEIYLPGYEKAWKIGRELGLPIALHVVGIFGMAGSFDKLAKAGEFKDDDIFIHMTGMSDMAWQVAGAVATLMDRSNVDTVLVAGKIRKWRYNGRCGFE